MFDASNLIRLPIPVQKHEPPKIPPFGLCNKTYRLHPTFLQIVIDEDRLYNPRGKKLNEDSDGCVSGQSVGELEQPNRTLFGASIVV